MSTTALFALFGAMLLLAVVPGPGVLAVTSRAVSGGFAHGASTTLGVVLGDYVFVLLSIAGLALVAETMASVFLVIKYLGAGYLIWLGISLIRTKPTAAEAPHTRSPSHHSSILLGLTTTLGNPKAILFYASFFPAFVDLGTLQGSDILAILAVITLALGCVKLTYAWLAISASSHLRARFNENPQASRMLNLVAGGVLVGGGAYIAARS